MKPLFKRRQEAAATAAPQTRKARIWSHCKSLASTVAFVWLFTTGVAQATIVPTGSMEPTILVGDHFFLDKVAFPANYPEAFQRFLPERTIRRGDIVAFWSPENPELRLVKRVVAVGGDTFEIRQGDVFIDGAQSEDPHAVHSLPPAHRNFEDFGPITIPADSFFMMGDNRDDSRDSRFFGGVHRTALIGKPTFIYWSYESGPYQPNRTLREWAEHYGSMAIGFVSKTRWGRTGRMVR